MHKKLLIFLSIIVIPFLSYSSILEVEIKGPIHVITAEYITQAIERGEKENSQLLIIKMNTPGGLDESMRKIIEKIINAKIPVATYVSPSGARAASAGFFILVASDIAIMAPGTNTGAAHPVLIGTGGEKGDKTMTDKITHDAASYIKSLASRRGRNVKMAEEAVRKSLSYTEEEALNGGLIDLIAKDEQEIINSLDGKKIKRFDGREIILKLKGEELVFVPMSNRQKFLNIISNPNLAYILLMLGLLGIYFELANPGAIFPGVFGGVCLLLAFFAFQILPVNYVGLLLILLAIVLFILEIKIQSYGFLTLGGIASLFLGSIMLIRSPIPELKPGLSFIIPVVIGVSLIFIFLIFLAIRAHLNRIYTGPEGMIGEIGNAFTDIEYEGKVLVHGEIWKARSKEKISKGSKVKVVRVERGLTLEVVKIDDEHNN
ncbi:nodulation protein NfeD [Candidatus Aminicenantes bacterium AC-708-M15]|jgi:membrane-bound serine protease (ClpP class)|nr:nodulation protein NfeD [SCandidatus Aminicenantes bacterium Aminicenantia_JdfR_composite]MCP2604152.1 nodulation protein NfeD [Candidatus Aminicenantes bacterium AC-708-M15]MCP2617941.1 nodulation protein NfeD [Candidatus Aminicenantes bacterium AC-335-A11]